MPRGPEAEIQKQVKNVYAVVGACLYDLSQGYRKERGGTRQTPGIPDLWGFLPPPAGVSVTVEWENGKPTMILPGLFWHEVKTTKGLADHHRLLAIPPAKVKPYQADDWNRAVAQARFRILCEVRGIPYAIGGVEEAKELLLKVGLAYKDDRGTIFLGKRRAA